MRRINAPGRHLFTVEVEDSRVVRAVMVASEGLGSSPEEYILAKLLEGVVTDGYLKSEVLDQLRVKKYVEESLRKERRRDSTHRWSNLEKQEGSDRMSAELPSIKDLVIASCEETQNRSTSRTVSSAHGEDRRWRRRRYARGSTRP